MASSPDALTGESVGVGVTGASPANNLLTSRVGMMPMSQVGKRANAAVAQSAFSRPPDGYDWRQKISPKTQKLRDVQRTS